MSRKRHLKFRSRSCHSRAYNTATRQRKSARWQDNRLRGMHDRWSREASPRVVMLAFSGSSFTKDRWQQYMISVRVPVYYNESGHAIEVPQVAFRPQRVIAIVLNPVTGQHVRIEQIKLHDVDVLVQPVPIEMFDDAGIELDCPGLQLGETVRVEVRCTLDLKGLR